MNKVKCSVLIHNEDRFIRSWAKNAASHQKQQSEDQTKTESKEKENLKFEKNFFYKL